MAYFSCPLFLMQEKNLALGLCLCCFSLSHPLFLITGSHSGGFLIRVAYVCLVKSIPEAAVLFVTGSLRQRGGSLRPGPGSWQDWMYPAEDISCHSAFRQYLCFQDAAINHSAVPSAPPASGPGVGEAWCKERQGPGLSSSLSLEVTWWLKCPRFLRHPLIPACVLLLLLEIQQFFSPSCTYVKYLTGLSSPQQKAL